MLAEAARTAVELTSHGRRRSRLIATRLSDDDARVPCPRGLLLQAIVQLLLAGGDGGAAVTCADDALTATRSG